MECAVFNIKYSKRQETLKIDLFINYFEVNKALALMMTKNTPVVSPCVIFIERVLNLQDHLKNVKASEAIRTLKQLNLRPFGAKIEISASRCASAPFAPERIITPRVFNAARSLMAAPLFCQVISIRFCYRQRFDFIVFLISNQTSCFIFK